MKTSMTRFTLFLLTAVMITACNNMDTTILPEKAKAEKELVAANNQFYAALNALFTGDLEPMNAIWSHGDDISDMGPFGGRLEGWKSVSEEFQKEAGMKLGGRVECKDLLVYAGTDVGYTVCTEEGENMTADGKAVKVKFRATNIFRIEKGQWKMIHHHTDLSVPLMENTGNSVE